MKKSLKTLLEIHSGRIKEDWISILIKQYGNKLSEHRIRTFVSSSFETIEDVVETSDYKPADQYLIDIYNLFSEARLNLLEVSQFFTNGRNAVINILRKEEKMGSDPVAILGFLDEIIEQIFARYGILHQDAQMKELSSDRDRLAAKLDTNQRYLSNILDQSDSAILFIDKDEKIIAWSTGAENIFGYTEEEVIGHSSSLLIPDAPEYAEELKIIKENVAKYGYYRVKETERKTKSGELIPVQLNVTPLPGHKGEYTGRSIIIKDSRHIKELQQQVNQSEKLAVIGQLAAGIAHEIGNPLTAISSVVQLMQRKSGDPQLNEQLAQVKENIDRISKIVRELVDFSRPPGYEKMIIQITDVIKTALGIVKYDKRVKKVEFKTSFDQDMPLISIVSDQLLQVFVNILFNALDATEGNGEISVKTWHDENYAMVEITDTGCGIDPAIIDKIFDPFFTTKEVGKGTGLGLSVSYGIIKKFNGDIIVKSAPGKGSSFTIKIPKG
ncbi:MAG: PAS domain S-box protein [Ignavibacteria bacterium]|nr:PAS domain S-box protein [Ignavibacteria bacterium]